MSRWIFPLIICCFLGFGANGQEYDPVQAFAQGFFEQAPNEFRSADGSPGPKYWQNTVNYNLEGDFDTTTLRFEGKATIHYINNSPNELDFLWLTLDQNGDKADALGKSMKHPVSVVDTTNGFHLQSVDLLVNGTKQSLRYKIYGTLLKIYLPQPISANGGKADLNIDYHYTLLPHSALGRSGFLARKDGRIFEFGYWYPRLCVYDDLRGWNTLPYVGGGEFYCEFGDIDYKLTVPSGMIVAGSGQLMNAREILSPALFSRFEKAQQSSATVIIRPGSEVGKVSPTKAKSGKTTWHFNMKDTRDVAFAVSNGFIWDGAKADLPNQKTVFVQSFYPTESAQINKYDWKRATEFLKANVEIFSKSWLIYPYPTAVSVAGGVGGMEYPALSFDWHQSTGKELFFLLAHEGGHTWYPMIVGANERRFPFMDEGFNVFMGIYSQAEFNNGEYAPKRDGEYAPGGGNPADEIVPIIQELQDSYTLLTAPDRMHYKYVHPLSYFKAAFGMVLLREVILGPDRFDEAFQTYSKRWAFKHPSPNDFFRTMNNVSGEDLNWFWRGWFQHNWVLDQAVKGVAYKNEHPEEGALITVENLNRMVMPLLIDVQEENGKIHHLRLPVGIWAQGKEWTFEAPTTSKITKVQIDPDQQLPDENRDNNRWPRL